ncbi:hypothetical protein BASA81_008264 [Batrachochytrium salamandrivorans]|nr:hypothetical protein BASA81_008264 [Batrachochytrium salamandrivorans]
MSSTTNVVVLCSGSVLVSVEAKSALSRTESRVLFRAIFNPNEGLQRDLLGLQWSTSQLSLIGFTSLVPSKTCGMAGLYFAMSDMGAGTLRIRGPTLTKAFVAAWQPFVRRKFPVLECKEVESLSGKQARVEQLGGVTLVSVSLKPCPSGSVCVWCLREEEESSSEEEESSSEEEDVLSSSEEEETHAAPLPPSLHRPVFAQTPSASLCYLMQIENGGEVMAVVDCPSLQEAEWLSVNPHLQFRCAKHAPVVVVHLTSEHICQSIAYVAWQQRQQQESPTTTHVFAHQSHTTHRHFSPYVLQWQHALHVAAPQVYRAPTLPHKHPQWVSISNNTVIVTSPQQQLDDGDRAADVVAATVQDENEIQLEEDDCQSNKVAKTDDKEEGSDDAFVLFLGTGAAKPSPFRGLSACLVGLGAGRSVLLDCGEDTIHQLLLYGEGEVLLESIQHVWISHHHLDHFGGVCSIVYQRYQRFGKQTVVLGPQSVVDCLRALFSEEMAALGHSQTASRHIAGSRTFKAIHCFDSHGIYLPVGNKCLLVYSGDTRPNPIHKLHNPDHLPVVLVHEATFDDTKQDEACKKRHSTVGEAIQVARDMRAGVLLLTHASQRYPKHLGPSPHGDGLVVMQVHDFFKWDLQSTQVAHHLQTLLSQTTPG